MAKLLVSVRSVAEALAAFAAGADLIDVKEPNRGALGMADAAVLDAIATALGVQVPLSVALGELHEGHRLPAELAGRVSFAKFGLAAAADSADWSRQLRAAVQRLPVGTTPVGVAYADWRAASAPAPDEVLDTIVAAGCGGLLLDTFDKSGGGLLAHLPIDELQALAARARSAGLVLVLAGKIGRDDLTGLLAIEPDYVGVRGAVCRAGRQSTLDAQLVRHFAALVHGQSSTLAAAARQTV